EPDSRRGAPPRRLPRRGGEEDQCLDRPQLEAGSEEALNGKAGRTMSNAKAQIAQTLSRLASTPGTTDFFAVQRVQVAGEPTGWRDEITFERGQFQTYARNRSAADEGGPPIGVWRAPAEDWRTQAIADALCRARIWSLESDAEIE